jgi:hypothetical protein
VALAIDPLTASMQENLFANNHAFGTYRFKFNHMKDDSNTNGVRVGEVGLPGVAAPQPRIGKIAVDGGKLIISGNNSTTPGDSYSVLMTTNVALPQSCWTVLTNGVFDSSGNFSSTNAASTTGQRFFILRIP